jgi:CheY-like chemotaxis protein
MRVLILEDELLLQMQMQLLVEDLGFEVVGPHASVAPAMADVAADNVDCALLDLNLRGETSLAVADALAAKSIPFALTSGSNASDLTPRFAGRVVFIKPVDENQVKKFLAEVGKARVTP